MFGSCALVAAAAAAAAAATITTTTLNYDKRLLLVVQMVPGVKLVAVLRNPIDRAMSEYYMECVQGSRGS